MKHLKLTITIAALSLYLSCKKDTVPVSNEYLQLNYQTTTGAADTTVINITGNSPLVSTNVTTPAVSQDPGSIIGVSGSTKDLTAVLKVVTPCKSEGNLNLRWVYANGRVSNITLIKSDRKIYTTTATDRF